MLQPGAQRAGCVGGALGGAADEAYVPRLVDLSYVFGEGPNAFHGPRWNGEALEEEDYHGSPGDTVDPFSDDDRAQQVSQHQVYANNGLQVNQTTAMVEDSRATAPPSTGAERWGLRMEGLEPRPPQRREEQASMRM